MAYKYIATIPLDTIDHIELFDNSKKRLSINQVKASANCDYVLNGGLFNMKTFVQYCNVKINGVVISNPKYNEYGMAWNTNDILMTLIPDMATAYKNYIGMKALCYKGVDKPVNDHASDIGGKRGRSAIALKGKNLVLYCSKDATSYAKYPTDLRAELKALGCTDILMLDSGGSSQCNFKGNYIYTGRVVANMILVYLKKTTPTAPTTAPNIVTAPVSMTPTIGTLSATVNLRTGPGTKYDRIGSVTKGSKVTVTGKTVAGDWYRIDKGWISANYTYLDSNKTVTSKCPYACPTTTISYGAHGDSVKWAQWYLKNKYGYSIAIDGSFGPATKNAVIDFQGKHNLTKTGTVNTATRNAILN